MSDAPAQQYIRRIRNKSKQAYARSYLAWLANMRPDTEPERPSDVSYMAAQGVRLQLMGLARPRLALSGFHDL
jgi:hypothetical protein